MIHYVLSARRRRRKQVSIFLVNAAPQLIRRLHFGVSFLEPSDIKQAHWITLSRFAKTTKRFQ